MSFKEWCELNGRRWEGAKSFEEFAKNAKDYEAYIEKKLADKEEE